MNLVALMPLMTFLNRIYVGDLLKIISKYKTHVLVIYVHHLPVILCYLAVFICIFRIQTSMIEIIHRVLKLYLAYRFFFPFLSKIILLNLLVRLLETLRRSKTLKLAFLLRLPITSELKAQVTQLPSRHLLTQVQLGCLLRWTAESQRRYESQRSLSQLLQHLQLVWIYALFLEESFPSASRAFCLFLKFGQDITSQRFIPIESGFFSQASFLVKHLNFFSLGFQHETFLLS